MSGIQGKLCMLGHSMTELLTINELTDGFGKIDQTLKHDFEKRFKIMFTAR